MVVTNIYFFARAPVVHGILCAVIALSGARGSVAAEGAAASDMCTKIKKLTKIDGFLTFYKDEENGKIYIEMPKAGAPDMLFQSILTSGIGSRDIGSSGADALDRGKFGSGGLVSFRRFGSRVLLVERNTNYYTPNTELDSPRDAGLSFPNAVLAGFDIQCDDIVDATDFFLHDWINIPEVMKVTGQELTPLTTSAVL
jgi:hypothetical protein